MATSEGSREISGYLSCSHSCGFMGGVWIFSVYMWLCGKEKQVIITFKGADCIFQVVAALLLFHILSYHVTLPCFPGSSGSTAPPLELTGLLSLATSRIQWMESMLWLLSGGQKVMWPCWTWFTWLSDCSTMNYIWYSVINHNRKQYEKECVYIGVALLCSSNTAL